MDKHTPTPWYVAGYGIVGPKATLSDAICTTSTNRSTKERDANIAFIVRAVNNFEMAIRYLAIEHRKEKEGPHHGVGCELCRFIAEAGYKK